MPTAVVERNAPTRTMQGVSVPGESVNNDEFFKRTRRHIQIERQESVSASLVQSWQPQVVFELRKSDILAGVLVTFSGTLVVTGGTAKTSARWPYDMFSSRFTANGASNIINCSGLKLKIRDVQRKGDQTDRGVVQKFANTDRSQGTLAKASESWGVGAATTAIPAGTYDVELEWWVPVAEDEVDLAGAIFLQTSSSDLTLTLDLLPLTSLIAAETATAITLNGNFKAISTKYSIPVGPNGGIVVPDLSMFHSLIQSRVANGIQQGENEHRLIGQGAGKSLLRAFFQVYSGADAFSAKPLAMNRTNFGKLMWRYANNETPDEFVDGSHMRLDQERRYNCDVGSLWGVGTHDFAHENALRDHVDMGTTAELRLVTTLNVAPSNPALEYVTETVFLAGQA